MRAEALLVKAKSQGDTTAARRLRKRLNTLYRGRGQLRQILSYLLSPYDRLRIPNRWLRETTGNRLRILAASSEGLSVL
jgi:regulator of replication initiation timing